MTTRTRGLLAFLAISFAGTFLIAPLVHFGLGMSLASPLAQLPAAFLPAIAAIVVRRWVTREGFADAGLAWAWRRRWPYYLAAWLGPLVLAAGALAVAAAAGLWRADLKPLGDVVPGLPGWAFVVLLMVVFPLAVPLYWGEEFGWTGYLRLRLFPGRPLAATLGTGLIWAVWHYPLPLLGYLEFANLPLGLAVWTVSFLAQEVVLSWLRLRSGSIWPASLAHAGNNLVLSLLPGILLDDATGLDAAAVIGITTAPILAVAIWLLATGRYRDPDRGSRPESGLNHRATPARTS